MGKWVVKWVDCGGGEAIGGGENGTLRCYLTRPSLPLLCLSFSSLLFALLAPVCSAFLLFSFYLALSSPSVSLFLFCTNFLLCFSFFVFVFPCLLFFSLFLLCLSFLFLDPPLFSRLLSSLSYFLFSLSASVVFSYFYIYLWTAFIDIPLAFIQLVPVIICIFFFIFFLPPFRNHDNRFFSSSFSIFTSSLSIFLHLIFFAIIIIPSSLFLVSDLLSSSSLMPLFVLFRIPASDSLLSR